MEKMAKQMNGVLSHRMANVFPLNRRCDQNDLYLVKQVQSNIYNEQTNPNGIVNLGVAFSFICDDIIKDKLKKVKLGSAQLGPANGVGSFNIHVIIDECNNFCILKDGVRFKSVVAFDRIPDPNRTHVLWTFTKDFSAVGARISAIYSFSPEVVDSFKVIKPFCATSVFSHNVCQEMIDDRHWCQEIYFPSIIDRLRDCYKLLEDRLNKIGAIVYPVEGGFTALVSFQKFLRSDTFEEEIELLHQFLKCGVYMVPGQFIWCSQPGWFRIAFSHPKTFVQLGLERIEEALVKYGGPLP